MPAEVSVGLLALPLSRRRCRRQPLQSHRFAFCRGADPDRLLLLLCAGRFQGAGECASTCRARSTRCRRGRHPSSLEGPACRRLDCSRCPSKRSPSKRGPCCSCPRQPRRQRQHGSTGPRRSGGSRQRAAGSGAWACCCHGWSCHSGAPAGTAGGQGSVCQCARQGDCGAVRLTDRHSTGGRC